MVVKLVSASFVPVTLNTDRLPDTDAGKFFRGLMKQWPQGLWVVTPEGKVLGHHYHKAKPGEAYAAGQKRWVDDTIEMLRTAAKDAGPLAPREVKERPDPLAGRGKGVDEDGDVRLAVSVLPMLNGRQEGAPVVDSVRLTAEQWAEFLPPEGKATAGTTWTVPESTARQFAPMLSPMTDSIFTPKPIDVTTAKVTAKVERVANGVAVIRFAGKWESAHDRDGDPRFPIRAAASGGGVGVLDTKTGKLTAVTWVLAGEFRNSPPGDKPRATAAVVEWVAGP